jgi:GNAT superfamily N-acetyltransferase
VQADAVTGIGGAAIIRADAERWPLVRQVRLAALAADPSAFGSTLQRELGYDEARWRGFVAGAANFLAVADGLPVGIASIRRLAGGAAGSELNGMWVQPEYRGAGIGAALLAAALDTARAGRYGSVRLWVTGGNLGATALFERFGFTRTGHQAPLPSDPGLVMLEYVLAVA